MLFTKTTNLNGKSIVVGYDYEKGMYLIKNPKSNEKEWIKDFIFEALIKVENFEKVDCVRY